MGLSGRRQRSHNERGQALVLFALFLLALIASGGLLIDGGLGWTARREAQTAADMAALAAVRAKANGTAITAAAQDLAASNGFPAGTVSCGGVTRQGVVVNNPPAGAWSPPAGLDTDPTHYIEVVVTRPMRTVLAGIVGQSCWLVSARAVARFTAEGQASGAPYPAILGSSACDPNAVNVRGNGMIVTGDVVSNSGISDPGNGTVVSGSMSFVPTPTGCGPFAAPVPSNGDIYTPTASSTLTPYPVMYSLNTSTWTVTNTTTSVTTACTFTGGNRTISDVVPAPGVYCANGNITLNANGMIASCTAATGPCGITLVATGKIEQTGSAPYVLDAYWDNLLAFSLYNDTAARPAIDFKNGLTFIGLIFAPDGTARVTGNNGATSNGAVWGKTVVLEGNAWTLTAAGLGTTTTTTETYRAGTLVE